MKIRNAQEFIDLTPNERKFILKELEIKPKTLASIHNRSITTISFALDNKRPSVLKKISKTVENRIKKMAV